MKNKINVPLVQLIGIIAIVAVIGFSMAACGDDDDNDGGGDKNVTYELGDVGPGGGRIFYKSVTGFTMTDNNQVCHYLEAAPRESRTFAWASSGYTSADITGVGERENGNGRKNTALILATDANAPAAKFCKEYNGGGKTDWFLPSYFELKQLRDCAATSANGEVFQIENLIYWSSSYNLGDMTSNIAVACRFSAYSADYLNRTKDTTLSVRAIRAF
ncbi:Lcl C-terminal domain-containing protein [Treponema sp. R80B11-R83G3]